MVKRYDKRDDKEFVECEYKVSEKCKKIYSISKKALENNKNRNSGKFMCFLCSKRLKISGRNNPNCKYIFDDNLFSVIDNEYKAYILGMMAAESSIYLNTIRIHQKEYGDYLLKDIRNYICKELPIFSDEGVKYISINSMQITKDVCKHLKISPGKKSYVVKFPEDIPDEYKRHFVRGIFDGDGWVSDINLNKNTFPTCGICSFSRNMIEKIYNFLEIPGCIVEKKLAWSGNNAIDVMGILYENSNIYLRRKKELYYDWCSWVPSLSGNGRTGNTPLLKWSKTIKDAVPPSKAKVSDSGYDLVLVEKIKTSGDVELYTTGIKIQPSYGWYFELAPRSSIAKTGYMLTNSFGVIDRSYIGPIIVALRKINKDAPDIELPCKLVQIIPRPIIHAEIVEVENLDDTFRGDGGFGSSDKKR
jgi:deoxyuridine 5'-triphosphate nucleotidohydrolase